MEAEPSSPTRSPHGPKNPVFPSFSLQKSLRTAGKDAARLPRARGGPMWELAAAPADFLN